MKQMDTDFKVETTKIEKLKLFRSILTLSQHLRSITLRIWQKVTVLE